MQSPDELNSEQFSGTSTSLQSPAPSAVSAKGVWRVNSERLLAFRGLSGFQIRLPGRWIDSARLEQALRVGPGPLGCQEALVHITIPEDTALMVDVAVRLLSLVNQLDHAGKRVILDFHGDRSPVYTYLDRIGFFDELGADIVVRPERPGYSAAQRYRGTNQGLVEIVRLNPLHREHEVPSRMEGVLTGAMRPGVAREPVAAVAYYLFAELIGNVYGHAEADLNGYAVLQVYQKARIARVAVTDSGEGLLRTLRRSLPQHYPGMQDWGSSDLLNHALREGKLSRLGKGHGTGLKGCADRAMRLRATTMEVLLSGYSLRLSAKYGTLQVRGADPCERTALIHGTHIMIEFPLD